MIVVANNLSRKKISVESRETSPSGRTDPRDVVSRYEAYDPFEMERSVGLPLGRSREPSLEQAFDACDRP